MSQSPPPSTPHRGGDWLTRQEAAAYLNRGVDLLNYLRRHKRVVYCRDDAGRPLFSKASLDEYKAGPYYGTSRVRDPRGDT
jgi:hypothetical protein